MFNINHGLISAMTFSAEWQLYTVLMCFIVLSIAVSYLLGSVNTAIVVSKVFYRDDIRRYGSGNAGMTNMLRTFGGKAALLTLVGDVMKVVLAIGFTGLLLGFHYAAGISYGDGYCYIAGLFAMLGHIFPIFYGFKGGKGVLATAAMALILAPIPFLILIAIFVAIVWFSRYVSLGSVSVAILFPVVVNGYCQLVFNMTPGIISLCTIIIAIIIVWAHRENLKRISDRTERKLSFGKSKKESIEEKKTEDTDEGSEDEK